MLLSWKIHEPEEQWVPGYWAQTFLPWCFVRLIQLYQLYQQQQSALNRPQSVMSDKCELTGKVDGQSTLFAFDDISFVVGCPGLSQIRSIYEQTLNILPAKPKHNTSPYHVIWAQYSDKGLELDYLVRKGKKSPLQLVHVVAEVKDEAAAHEWAKKLMEVAYAGACSNHVSFASF